MCGENDDNGGAAGSSRRLPAVGAMRGPCGCEEKLKTTVVVVLSDDDDYEEEFRRYCENTTLPAKGDKGGRRRPAASKKQHRFHGIHRRKSGRWSAEIRDNMIKGSRSWVGTFDTAEEAAWAYDAVARRLYGPNARTNFPLPPPPPPPPVVVPLLPAPAVANKKMNSKRKKPVVAAEMVAPAGGEPAAAAGEMAPVLLGNALEATNGWEFEPYSSMGLVVGGAVYNYADEPETADELQLLHLMHGGAMVDFAADGCLWSF
uniref:AP2/ERF domain-containing protein n=1 Tax=Oryza glumipatula TaxID=40148 RepID=A0A0E0BUX4_9ORYZ